MRVIGLTGGIASGKSTVAVLIRELGYPVIDADAVARDVVQPGQIGLARIIDHFGGNFLQGDGRLNRHALRLRIARDPESQQQLNRILHPLIRAEITDRLHTLAEQGHRLAFVEAALMIESGSHERYEAIILVTAPESTRLRRLVNRDNMSHEQAKALMARQWDDARKRIHATHEIVNDGAKDALPAKLEAILRDLHIR